jgi:hypothetical protein
MKVARKRMIDPSIWQSEDFGKLSTLAKIVFIGLFSLADDEGRGRCNPVYLKSTLFPYEENIRSADIDKTLSEISSNMSVVLYSYNGSSYYSLLSWDTFQKIDRPSPSKIPEYDENTMTLLFDDNSTNNRRKVVERSTSNKNKKIIEDKRNRIKEIYDATCTKLPQIQKLTDKRNRAIDNFIKNFTEEQFKKICQIANNSNFLTGKNDKGWKADFDFLMRIDKATNILEGKYNNVNIRSKSNFEGRNYNNDELEKLYKNMEE